MSSCNHQIIYLICHLIVYLTQASPIADKAVLSKLQISGYKNHDFDQNISSPQTHETDKENPDRSEYFRFKSEFDVSWALDNDSNRDILEPTGVNLVNKTQEMNTESLNFLQARGLRSMKDNSVFEPIASSGNTNTQNELTTERILPANAALVSMISTDEPHTTKDFYQELQKPWNDTANSTDYDNSSQQLEHAPVFKTHTLVKGVVLLVLGVIAFSGNVATLVSIIRRGRQHSSTVYLLLVHLSVADLLVTWFCIVGEGLWTLTVEWHGGNVLCKLFKMMQVLALYLSTFILVVIGFDRLCAVRFPMRRIKARSQVHKAVLMSWILSVVLSAPQAFIFRVAKGPFVEEFYQCVTYGFYTAPWQEQLYTSISLLCQFLIPLCIIIVTYAATFATIASRHRVFGGPRCPFDDARSKVLRKAKIKSLWITVVIVSTFIVCWTPYYVSMVVSVFLESEEDLHGDLGKDLRDAIFFFGSSTAVLNPLIYGAFHLRRRAERPSSSSRSSSRFEPSFALSTLRKVRVSQGKLVPAASGREARRTTHLEFF